MEEKEEDFNELCAEILKNWNSPMAHSFFEQNPFSHNLQLDPVYDHHIQRDAHSPHYDTQEALSCSNMETDISTSKPKTDDSTPDFELEHKEEDEIMKRAPRETTNNEKSNDAAIPLLDADTYFGTLFGRGVDATDLLPSLDMVRESNPCDESEDDFTIILNQNDAVNVSDSTNNGLETDTTPKKCPGSGENKHMPAKTYSPPTQIRSFVLPSNKTIFDVNIDHFGEKLWRNPGVDMSDFFNYGFDEKQWKDYWKLMSNINQAQVQAGSSGQSTKVAHGRRYSHKEEVKDEIKLDRGIDPKYASLNASDVIIEIVMRESVHENTQPISDNGNTPHINCRMISGNKILPYPMDGYSTEDRDEKLWRKEQHKKSDDSNMRKLLRRRKTDFSGYNDMGQQQHSFRRERDYYCLSQAHQKRVRFNQKSRPKLDIYSDNFLCSTAREQMEDCVSEEVQQESARGDFLTNSHNLEIEREDDGLMEKNIEEDPEKLKRRSERFKLPLPILKNATANKSMELGATDILATTGSDNKHQRPTRTRKWTSS